MSDPQQQRTRTLAASLVASAAAVAVVLLTAVPALVGARGGSDGGGAADHGGATRTSTTRTGTVEVPAGWRVESWGHLTWAVPGDWGYGTIDQWCAEDGRDREDRAPVLQRPFGVSTLVGCRPARGLGLVVSLGEDAPPTDPSEYVEGAAVAQERFGEVSLTVSTGSAALSERILGTVHRFQGRDPNGCPATAEPVTPGDGIEARPPVPWQRLSVCRYALAGLDGGTGAVLAQSELLTASDSVKAWQALRTAPAGAGPEADAEDCAGWDAEQAVLLRTAASEVAWVHYDGCSGHGVALLGDRSRQLTVEVLRWAMSPGWSGGLDGSVPSPPAFRALRR